MRLVVASFFLIAAGSASAGWERVVAKDEMRGKSIVSYTQTVPAITGSTARLQVSVLENANGNPGVIFNVVGAMPQRCDDGTKLCDVPVKFDKGSVEKELFVIDGSSLTPTHNLAFLAAMIAAKTLFIEVSLADGGRVQYKLDTAGLDLGVEKKPELSLMGFELGGQSATLPDGMKKYSEQGADICYSSENVSGVFGQGSVKSVSLCFYEGVLYLASIVPGSKAAYTEGVKFLDAKFGPYDKSDVYPRWPRDSGKVIDTNTRSATFLSIGKVDYNTSFMISDDVVSRFVPKRIDK